MCLLHFRVSLVYDHTSSCGHFINIMGVTRGGGQGGPWPPPFWTEWRPLPVIKVNIHVHPPPPPPPPPHWLNWLKADSPPPSHPLVESAKSGQHPPPPSHWLNQPKADSTLPPKLVKSAESGQCICGCQMAPPCPILPPPSRKAGGTHVCNTCDKQRA